MVFTDYMNSLSTEKKSEKAMMITRIAEACCKNETTVYNWIAGRLKPQALERKVICGVLNMSEEELFPWAKSGQQ